MKRRLAVSCYGKMEDSQFHYGEDVAIIYPMIKEAKSMEIRHKSYYYHRLRKGEVTAQYLTDNAYFDKLYVLYQYLTEQFCDNKQLTEQIEYFYMYSVWLRKRVYGDYQKEVRYLFPFDKVSKGKSIVLYGAGLVGRSYMEQIRQLEYCKVVLWVDRNFRNFVSDRISPVEEIQKVSFDKVVIAIESKEIGRSVKEMLAALGVERTKIVSGFLY